MDVETYCRYEQNSILRFKSELKVAGGRLVNTLYISTKVSFGHNGFEAYTELSGGPSLPKTLRLDYNENTFEKLESMAKNGHETIKKRISALEKNNLELDESVIIINPLSL